MSREGEKDAPPGRRRVGAIFRASLYGGGAVGLLVGAVANVALFDGSMLPVVVALLVVAVALGEGQEAISSREESETVADDEPDEGGPR